MNTTTSSLDNFRIASPCSVRWEEMTGSESIRYCGSCRLKVYNISALTRIEAETVLSHAEGRTCVRIYRRSDGTILTADCLVGKRTMRRRLIDRIRTVAAALLALLAGGTAAGCGEDDRRRGHSIGDTTVPAPPPHASPLIGDTIAVPLPDSTPSLHRRR